jgi:membrane-associated phospholipid phosphatase
VSAPDRQSRWRTAAAVAVAVACAVGVAVLHAAFVGTVHGQVVDQAAQDGARIGRHLVLQYARGVLQVVSGGSLVVAVLIIAAIGLAQRRVRLALATAVLVAGSTATTELLKKVVLQRPDLDVTDFQVNSLPSGHTTFAAAVSLAALLAVPARLRPAVAVAGAAYTAVTGVATLVVRWHRPSDVVAAVLVVGAWGALVSALGPPPEPQPEHEGVVRRLTHRTAVVVLGAGAGAGAAVAAALLAVTWQRASPVPAGRLELAAAYVGGACGIVAACCAVVLVVLLLRRPSQAHRPVPDARRPTGSMR